MQDGVQKEENWAPSWSARTQIYAVVTLAGCAVLAMLFIFFFQTGPGPLTVIHAPAGHLCADF